MLYKILRVLFSVYFKIRYNPKVIIKEKIPEGGAILIANHSNNLDFISMGYVTKDTVYFMAKNTLFKGILKVILNKCGVIPVDRTKKDKTPIAKGSEVLNSNKKLGIFPEGTFNKTENILAPFKIGAVKLSYETKKPIVPIAIVGKYKRNKISIVVGKKYYVNSEDLNKENEIIYKRLESMIKSNKEV